MVPPEEMTKRGAKEIPGSPGRRDTPQDHFHRERGSEGMGWIGRHGALGGALLLLVALAGGAVASERPFEGSPEGRYMGQNNSPEGAPLREEVMKGYFQTLDHRMSDKRAKNYAIYVETAAEKFAVDPFLVAALMIAESNLVWTARDTNHYGLMMIEWDAHRQWIYRDYPNVKSLRILFKPVINVRIGTRILRENLDTNAGDVDATLDRCYARGRVAFVPTVFAHYKNLVTIYREKGATPSRTREPGSPGGSSPGRGEGFTPESGGEGD